MHKDTTNSFLTKNRGNCKISVFGRKNEICNFGWNLDENEKFSQYLEWTWWFWTAKKIFWTGYFLCFWTCWDILCPVPGSLACCPSVTAGPIDSFHTYGHLKTMILIHRTLITCLKSDRSCDHLRQVLWIHFEDVSYIIILGHLSFCVALVIRHIIRYILQYCLWMVWRGGLLCALWRTLQCAGRWSGPWVPREHRYHAWPSRARFCLWNRTPPLSPQNITKMSSAELWCWLK